MKDFFKALAEIGVKFAYPAVKPALDEMVAEGGAEAGEVVVNAVKSTDTPWDNEAARKLSLGLRAAADAIDAGLADA